MLEDLHVSGLGVIDEAWLELGPGLNALTGETGTGKTMLTVALGLALGARAGAGIVRAGRPAASVEARFSVDGLGGGGEPDEWAEGGELILARTVSAEGRSTARAGGRLAPASALARAGERLVEFHGQHQTERLLSPAAQTEFVDRYAGAAHLQSLGRYRRTHSALRRAAARLGDLDRDAREREREKDLLAYQVREIEAARVQPGELATLLDEESRLAHAERILELAGEAEAALGAEGAAADGLRRAAAALRDVAALDAGAGALAGRLGSVVADAEDALAELRAYGEAVEVDPGRLGSVRERIQVLKGLRRKYGDDEGSILAFLEDASKRLAALTGSEGERDEIVADMARLDEEARAQAAEVTSGRRRAASALADALTAEVRELGMAGARLELRLEPHGDLEPDGAERVAFLLSGGPSQPLQPLARVASGGELSRAMLACRSVLAELDEVPTLVFDEVDAGIGGRTARAVGARLAALGRRRQVLVVTHLAQIAAHADRHFVVTKDRGAATVRRVEGEDRVAELARMLSGSTAEVPLAHARDLLAEAAPSAGNGRARARPGRR